MHEHGIGARSAGDSIRGWCRELLIERPAFLRDTP
jgi:hypothetical protein